jgi:hypothetical protein
MLQILPKLRQLEVSPDKLVLDPNNPRLITNDEQRVPEEHSADPGVIEETRRKLGGIGDEKNDRFEIRELERSILTNGWQPIDFIFVKAFQDSGKYLVLEGNRRVAAIRNILSRGDVEKEIRSSLQSIEVMEVMGNGPPEQLHEQVNYLLGVRHHGSLRKWSPFAQAYNIYRRYLELSKQDDKTFRWDGKIGQQIANALSIPLDQVNERLRVFRVMQQAGNVPEVRNSEQSGGGMKDRYYSVCRDGLMSGKRALQSFIQQDQATFLLDEQGVERLEHLCHFSRVRREGAPLNNPQEWRPLGNILADEDEEKRKENIRLVLELKEKPSVVWAKRADELRKLQWDKWLQRVVLVLSTIQIGDDFGPDAKTTIEKLCDLIEVLDAQDK